MLLMGPLCVIVFHVKLYYFNGNILNQNLAGIKQNILRRWILIQEISFEESQLNLSFLLCLTVPYE